MLEKSQIRHLIKAKNLKAAGDVQEVLKEMFKDVLQEMLEAELEEELGYSKYDWKNKPGKNSRNGHFRKQVKSSYGQMELKIPRDRESQFEPVVVAKHQSDVSSLEEKVLSMYARGMSTRDITAQMEEMYGIEMSADTVSRITDKVLPLVKQWQDRPLEELYPIVYFDGLRVKLREEGKCIQKTAHIIIGIDLNGHKDVLGIWLAETESARFWLEVLNELKNRGVKDILISCVDGLTGFEKALRSVYPQTQVQRCILHQVRNSCRFVNWKDRKELCRDMRRIYQSPTESLALEQLGDFAKKWEGKYGYAVKSWYENWESLATFFQYSPEIRRLIYTTNPIESYNRSLRKYLKTKGAFPSEQSLLKMLYLATCQITDQWNQRVNNWSLIISQLTIHFQERMTTYF